MRVFTRSRRRRVAAGLILVLGGVLVVTLLRSWQPKLYRVTTLPSLGGSYTMAHAINDRGQVVGVSELADGTDHLFLWDRENGMQDLGPVVDDLVRINDVGQIVATMRDPNDNNRAFIWDPNGGRRILPTLGGDHGEPSAINNVGQVVGHAETATGGSHAFVWDADNGIRDLTGDSMKPSRAFSINDAGQVIVFAGGPTWLVSARDGKALTSQGEPLHTAYQINNAGVMVGLSKSVNGRFDVGVWRPDSGVEQIAQLKGAFPGMPMINDRGQVVFWQRSRARVRLFGRTVFLRAGKNYLWDARQGQVALDGCVKLRRGEDLWITDLNNHGCLVGAAQSRTGRRSRAVLLEPIPERWGK